MKNKRHSRCGFFHPRILLSLAICAGGVLLALLAFALYPGATALAQQDQTGGGDLAAAPATGGGIWEIIDNSSIPAAAWQAPIAGSYRVLRLNREALAQQLARAPMERTGDLRNSPAILSLPMPDGSFQRFHIEQSPVVDAALVVLYPEIKSYRGQGIDDGTATVRFDLTPLGFHALVLSADRAVNILPPNQADTTTYASYYDRGEAFKCDVTGRHQTTGSAGRVRSDVPVGSTLRTYRIAIAATNEFCVLLGGNTVADSTAAINALLNGINAIWERELSVHMNLVNAANVIYAGDNLTCDGPCTGANDPYTNGNANAMLNEVQTDLDAKVGVANYDIGHVLPTNSGSYAYVGVVCQDGWKGRGVSSVTSAGDSGSVGVWAHELGHQFGGNHTFNGTTSGCGVPNRNGPTAVEPGSGITILSYAGGCGPDNINGRDLRWHAGTFAELSTFLAGAQAMGCAVNTATGNTIPTVSAGTPFTIPRNTPFTLTATGTDADPGDIPNLTFIWEQVDAGGVCPGAGCFSNPPYGDQGGDPATTTRPLFRVFSPIAGKSRTFPSLTYILNNANVPPAVVGGFQTAENLPSVSRTMNFRATVRDNRAGSGGVNDSSVAITVDGNSGPFAVTAPNGGGTLSGAQNVTWSVNNTNAAPVNCANVKITLSTDGGQNFPITLAASTPNSGTAAVVFPNGITSTNARVKVEALGNIFFDISDANFALVPADTCPAVSDISPTVGNVGNTVTIMGINFMNAGNVNGVKFTNNVTAAFNVVNNTTITTTVPAGAVSGPITISKAACPDVQTTSFIVCSNPPVALTIDDGSVESAGSNGSGAYYVNRLTPGAYPATLGQISIFWDPFQMFPVGTAINVVAGINAGGTANIDGTSLQTFAATAGAQPGFTTFSLPSPVTITAGDFVVGFQVPTDPGGSVPIAIDTNNPVGRSYVSDNGTTFTTLTGNCMIRAAQVFTGCSVAPTPTPTATATATPPPGPTTLGNISTRLRVETGDNALIGGFIVTGTQPKRVILRAIGPSLTVPGKLADPTIELRDGAGGLIQGNDNWRSDQEAEIITTGIPPADDLEAAIVATLPANNSAYTAIVRGVNNGTGVGLVEAYDLDRTVDSKLANISTRGLVRTGDNVLIAGTIVLGQTSQRALIRAIGPSLNLAGRLADPTLELRDGNGGLIRSNDNWRSDQEAEIIATGIPPTDDLESAIVATLPANGASYTAIVRGVNDTTGIAVVEIYALD